MSKKSFYKLALISAVVSAVSWIVFVIGQTSLPATSGISDPLEFFNVLQDARSTFLMYGWGGIFGTLLSIPFILAFYVAMKDTSPMVLLSTITALVGAVFTSLGFFKPLTLAYIHLPYALEASAEALPMIRIAAKVAVDVYEVPWALGSFLLFGLGFGLLGYLGLRSATGPKWLNIAGILAGLTGIVWLTVFLPFIQPVHLVLILSNILLIFIWSIGLSASLLRTESKY